MTRQEKESLLYSLYKASYYYGVKSLALEEAADERTKDLRDFAKHVMQQAEYVIKDIYEYEGRMDTLDARDMIAAIGTMESTGEADGRAKNPSMRTRSEVVRIIRSLDIDDDDDSTDEGTNCWVTRKGDCV